MPNTEHGHTGLHASCPPTAGAVVVLRLTSSLGSLRTFARQGMPPSVQHNSFICVPIVHVHCRP